MGLDSIKQIDCKNIVERINNSETELVNRKLTENSLTLLQNYNKLLPLNNLDTLKIASVSIGEESEYFTAMLSNYSPIQHFTINKNPDSKLRKEMLDQLAEYNLVIASIHQSNENPWKKHNIERNTDLFLQTLSVQSKLVVTLFSNPYSINDFLFTNNFDGNPFL